jgi:hypothetical protein
MSKVFQYAGIAASIVIIAFGARALYMGLDGRAEVRDTLAQEQIVGTPDMAGVAGEKVDTGAEAKQFAAGMRKHALEATGGLTYAQMGRYVDRAGKPTNDEQAAAVVNGRPVENAARNIWVTETALATALNTAFFAENGASFAIVMGVALLLVGGGFLVLTLRVLRQVEQREAATRTRPAEAAVAAG